jgi:hypothetical protein
MEPLDYIIFGTLITFIAIVVVMQIKLEFRIRALHRNLRARLFELDKELTPWDITETDIEEFTQDQLDVIADPSTKDPDVARYNFRLVNVYRKM